jgi:hypothetical protein
VYLYRVSTESPTTFFTEFHRRGPVNAAEEESVRWPPAFETPEAAQSSLGPSLGVEAFPPAVRSEKQRLLSSGFPDWNVRDM